MKTWEGMTKEEREAWEEGWTLRYYRDFPVSRHDHARVAAAERCNGDDDCGVDVGFVRFRPGKSSYDD
jgi:hypothetical protein